MTMVAIIRAARMVSALMVAPNRKRAFAPELPRQPTNPETPFGIKLRGGEKIAGQWGWHRPAPARRQGGGHLRGEFDSLRHRQFNRSDKIIRSHTALCDLLNL